MYSGGGFGHAGDVDGDGDADDDIDSSSFAVRSNGFGTSFATLITTSNCEATSLVGSVYNHSPAS